MPTMEWSLSDGQAVSIKATRHLTEEEFEQMIELLTQARRGFLQTQPAVSD